MNRKWFRFQYAALSLLAMAVAAPAFAHHQPEFGDLKQRVANQRERIVELESGLRRCTVSGAALTDGVLRVRFTPDPGLWPRTS